MRLNHLIVALLTGLVAATYGFGIYLFAQLVPDMQKALGFDFSYVGAITAAGQFGFLISALLAAWLTPRLGGGQVIFGSAAVCGIALLLLPTTNSILLIGALLTILASTAATVFVPMVDVVSRIVPFQYRGMALGLVSSGTSYGVFINSLLVPVYAPKGEWRTVWSLVGLGTVLTSVIVFFVFRHAGLFSHKRQATTVSAESAGVAQGRRLFRRGSELLKPWVLIIWSMNFLIGFSTFPFQNYLSSYLRTELGFGIAFTAQIWAAIGFVGMFAGLAVGWLSDKTGLRAAMLLVYACVLLSALILVVHPAGHWPLLSGVLFATAFYPIFGLIPAYVSKVASSTTIAVIIFGIANVMQGTGGMIGNYCAGILAAYAGTFVDVYAAIAVSAVILAALTTRLPKELEYIPGDGVSVADREITPIL